MRTLSGNSSVVSVGELAEVIQKDPVILSKVIGAANTFGYNPGAVPVTNVAQAIHVIGYERIRSLAMSLMLLEQTSRTRSLDEQREAAALALTAGCIAQSAAQSRLLLDPEQAFVCAALRNFGRIVMVTAMADDFHAAQELADSGDTEDEAFRRTFGLTPLELSHQLLKAADLPEEILVTLRDLPPSALAVLDASPSAQMLALTSFAGKLAALALSPELTAADFARQARAIAETFSRQLPALANEIMPLMETAATQLDHFRRTFRLRSLPAESLARIKLRGAGIDPVDSVPSAAALPHAGEGGAGFTWESEIERLQALSGNPSRSRETLLLAVLDSVRRGFAAPECLLFSQPTPDADFRLAHGHGPLFKQLRSHPRVRAHDRNVFGVCLSRRENVVIHHAADPKITPYLPEWMREPLLLGAFALLPIVDEQHASGVILVGWRESRQITITTEHVRLIRRLLAIVGDPGTLAARRS